MASSPSSAGLVVVGGGPAGLEAARAYRLADGSGPVTVVSADLHPPYHRPPLSKEHLRGESGVDELPLEDDRFYVDRQIDLRLRSRVTALDPIGRRARLDGGEVLPFDSCVLATGSSPTPLPVPGADHPDVLHLRSRHDGERLLDRVRDRAAAVVVGSGFIGCEAATSLASRGLDVVLLTGEAAPQQDRLGAAVAERIAGWLDDAGVRLVTSAEVSAIDEGQRVELKDGRAHSADVVLVAAGVRQHDELGRLAGLDCRDGRIMTDSSMRTSAADVLAAGDVAFALNDAAGRHLSVEHWGEAVRMGEIAGTVAAGGHDTWRQAPGFWSEIAGHALKYAAWGDGYDQARMVDHDNGAFTVWYTRDDVVVGVLSHDADDDYEHGSELVESGAPFAQVAS